MSDDKSGALLSLGRKPLGENDAREAFMLRLSDALRPLADPARIQLEAMRVLGEQLGVTRAQYYEAEPNDEYLISPGGYANGVRPVTERLRMDDFGPYVKEAFRAGRTLAVADVSTDSRVSEAQLAAYDAFGCRAFVGIPLLKDGRFVVAVGLHDAAPHEWTDHEIALAEETAERTWATVERARAEAALHSSEDRYRTLFESIDEGFVIAELLFDATGKPSDLVVLETNPSFNRMMRTTNPVGKRAREIFPDAEASWFEAYGHVVKTGESLRFENYLAPLDSWFELYISRLGAAESCRFAIVFNDVTKRKRRDANLALLTEVSQNLTGLTNIDAMMEALGGKIVEYLNLARCTWCEVIEAEDRIIMAPDWHRQELPSVRGEVRISRFFSEESRRRCRTGETLVITDVHGSSLVDAGSVKDLCEVASLVVVPILRSGQWQFALLLQDVAPRNWREDEIELMDELTARIWTRLERTRTEEALREREARFRAVANLVPDLLWESDRHGAMTWYNERWYEYTGQTPEQAIGLGWLASIHPDDRAASRTLFEHAVTHGHALYHEYRIRGVDGSYRWFLAQAKPVLDDRGTVTQWFGAATDVHEQRTALEQARLARAEADMARRQIEARVADRTRELARANAELAAEGAERMRGDQERNALRRDLADAEERERRRLSRELHDQFGQHLTGFSLGLTDLRHFVRNNASARHRLHVLEELARVMTHDVRALALELHPPELDDVGLESAIETYLEQWSERHGVPADARITGLSEQRLPTDIATALYRIVREALLNVAKHADAKQVSVIIVRSRGEVRLIVEDSGHGFNVETARHRTGPGRRLGLAGMRERATIMGGTLTVESSAEGTTLYVRIPVTSANSSSKVEFAAPAATATSKEQR